MKTFIFLYLSFILTFYELKAQKPVNAPIPGQIGQSSNAGLFDSDSIFTITLKGNIRKLLNDVNGEPKPFPVVLSYAGDNNSQISIPISVKTRGHFRRQSGTCRFPPLLLRFSNTSDSLSSFFPTKGSLKLVMPCSGDDYVIHEWLVYKLYNLVTPKSFRARLVKVKLVDENNKKMPSPFYGIILENENQMAARNGCVILKKNMKPQQTDPDAFLKMAVFEYLIGNTDWSVEYRQNIKLVAADSASVPVTVPYDFDLAGIVNSPYARPAEELKLSSVRERRYRGYCVNDIKQFDNAVAFYNNLKKKIYKTYTGCTLLDEKYINATTIFLDEFYETINNPEKLKKEFEYPCDPHGTGNVIIKGLRED
jgi:hypothetical protein